MPNRRRVGINVNVGEGGEGGWKNSKNLIDGRLEE